LFRTSFYLGKLLLGRPEVLTIFVDLFCHAVAFCGQRHCGIFELDVGAYEGLLLVIHNLAALCHFCLEVAVIVVATS
jgi:hypothetical protein